MHQHNLIPQKCVVSWINRYRTGGFRHQLSQRAINKEICSRYNITIQTQRQSASARYNTHNDIRTSCSLLSFYIQHIFLWAEVGFAYLPPDTCGNFSRNHSNKSESPLRINVNQHSLCEWVSVCSPKPKWCRRCHYTMFDCECTSHRFTWGRSHTRCSRSCIPCMCV